MKRHEGRIALPAARIAIDRIKSTEPPHVSIENARRILGPDLYRLIMSGWLDDDIVESLSGNNQNESDLRQLLAEARREERLERKKRKKAAAQRKPKRAEDHPQVHQIASSPAQDRPHDQPPMLTIDGPRNSPLALPAPHARDPEAGLPSSDHPIPHVATSAARPITRNRGIRRPD